MPFIEGPTTFYVGEQIDLASKQPTGQIMYYDSRHLTTHAMVVGMTGSGKTGLCLSLLEEAMLDNIPAIVIDPKGDIANLLLTFPELRAEDFAPWVNVDDARRAGMETAQFAAVTAQRWREGLRSSGITPERLLWLQHAARVSVFTPGSDAGLPVSILASLKAPGDGWAGHEEEIREEISGVVTALLGLIGRNATPVQDKDHVLLCNLFEYHWSRGHDLSLEQIVREVQQPPFERLGVFSMDDYLSPRLRGKLASELNNILAAPSFQAWMNGEPLDIQQMLYTPEGRPRVSIFYLAHLNEAERQFVMTLLLESVLSWMRHQSGTTSLRALLYIDEMYGYFPPYPFNPPTKTPLLRLLKQARAFGLGLILATQNPGDLDYKGLSNTGTWFIGRLSTDGDKQRLMAGLQSMSNEDDVNLRALSAIISDLEPRSFILRNVHDSGSPYVFRTRWTMSYLRGPLTRQQVQVLMRDQRSTLAPRTTPATYAPPPPDSLPGPTFAAQAAWQSARLRPPVPPPTTLPEAPSSLPEAPVPLAVSAPQAAPAPMAASAPRATPTVPAARAASAGLSTQPPALNPDVPQYFLPPTLGAAQAQAAWQQRTGFSAAALTNAALAYRPVLLAQAAIRFQDRKTGLYTVRLYTYQAADVERAGMLRWAEYATTPVDARAVATAPAGPALYGEVPATLTDPRRLTALRRELVDMLYATARLTLPSSSALSLYGAPDADPAQFQAQLQQAAREGRDAEVDALMRRYEDQLDRLNDQMQRFQTRVTSAAAELQTNKRLKTITTGEALLGLMQGRTAFTLSRMSQAEYWKQRSQGQLNMTKVQVEQINGEIAELQARFQQDVQTLNEKWARIAVTVEEHVIQPYKKDILMELFGVGWQPHWYGEAGGQPVLLPAN